MDSGWEIASACANIVMAVTAVIAAIYALWQYRSSIKIQELDQIVTMYQSTVSVVKQSQSAGWSEQTMGDVLNLLEIHERLIALKLLSANAVSFYRDAASINEDLHNIEDDQLGLMRQVLSGDPRGYRHLIASLRANEHTKYIVDW